MNIFSNIKGDLKGGLAAAAIAMPHYLGLGLIVFAPLGVEFASRSATIGMFSAVFAGAVAAILGGNPIQITGPRATVTMILAAAVATFAANPAISTQAPEVRQVIVVGLASAAVFLGGGFQVLFGLFDIGKVIKYIPYPVISGFMNGIGFIIIQSQIRDILGVNGDISYAELIAHPGQIEPLTLVIGLATLLLIPISKKHFKFIPAPLTAMIAGAALYHVTAHFATGRLGPVIGSIKGVLPRPDAFIGLAAEGGFKIALKLIPDLLVTALVLALIGSMETLLDSVVSDNLTGIRHNSGKELIGQGAGNIASSLFGAISSCGAAYRAVANFASGGRTRLSGVMCSLALLVVITALGPLVGKIPLTVVGAVIVYSGVLMFDIWTFEIMRKLSASLRENGLGVITKKRAILVDFLVVLLVAVITVCISPLVAVGVGVVIATILFLSKMSRSIIRRTYLGSQVHSKKMRTACDSDILELEGKRIAIIELQGPLFFGSAESLAKRIEDAAEEFTYYILDMKRVNEMDSTGANIILQIYKRLEKEGRFLLVTYFSDSLRDYLDMMNVLKSMGENRFMPDTDTALEWAEDHLLLNRCDPMKKGMPVPLEQMEITNGMTPEEIEALRSRLIPESYSKGAAIFPEGDTARDLFMLSDGLVSIKLKLPHSTRFKRVATYTPGGIFGEVALLDGRPRSASVWAEEDCQIYRLPLDAFESLNRDMPGVAVKLMTNIAKVLSRRLRTTSNEVKVLEES